MTIVTVERMIILPTALPPQRRSWAVSRLNNVRCNGSTVNPIPRLRYCYILLSCCPEQGPDLHQPSAAFDWEGWIDSAIRAAAVRF